MDLEVGGGPAAHAPPVAGAHGRAQLGALGESRPAAPLPGEAGRPCVLMGHSVAVELQDQAPMYVMAFDRYGEESAR
jgi:hypothetical protein